MKKSLLVRFDEHKEQRNLCDKAILVAQIGQGREGEGNIDHFERCVRLIHDSLTLAGNR